MKADIIDIKGSKSSSVNLNDKIFNVKINPAVVASAIRYQQANGFAQSAHTKDRSQVSGGGKKPWRQKGTGRARAGSNRSPIWRSGGVTFGPNNQKNRNLLIPKKIKRLALNMILSQKLNNKKILIVKDTSYNRKNILSLLVKQNIDANKILFITSNNQKQVVKNIRNVHNINTIGNNSINLLDVMKNDYIIWTSDAIMPFLIKSSDIKSNKKDNSLIKRQND